MGPISISFGVAAVAVVALSLFRGRRHRSFGVALMLVVFWGLANLTDPWVDPWVDVLGFVITFQCWYRRADQRWAIIVWSAFSAQLLTHVVFMGAPENYFRFMILNTMFAVELTATAFPGSMMLLRHFGDTMTGPRIRKTSGARLARLDDRRTLPDQRTDGRGRGFRTRPPGVGGAG